jgi:hypothetical protein
MKRLVAESLNEHLNQTTGLNEGLFGLSNSQRQVLNHLSTKDHLDDPDVTTLMKEKLIRPLLDTTSQLDTIGNRMTQMKEMILDNPYMYKDLLLKFIRAYTKGLGDRSHATLQYAGDDEYSNLTFA